MSIKCYEITTAQKDAITAELGVSSVYGMNEPNDKVRITMFDLNALIMTSGEPAVAMAFTNAGLSLVAAKRHFLAVCLEEFYYAAITEGGATDQTTLPSNSLQITVSLTTRLTNEMTFLLNKVQAHADAANVPLLPEDVAVTGWDFLIGTTNLTVADVRHVLEFLVQKGEEFYQLYQSAKGDIINGNMPLIIAQQKFYAIFTAENMAYAELT